MNHEKCVEALLSFTLKSWTVTEAHLVLRVYQQLVSKGSFTCKGKDAKECLELASQLTGADSQLIKKWLEDWKAHGKILAVSITVFKDLSETHQAITNGQSGDF